MDFFADDNTVEQKNSNLRRLEDISYDYQLIDTEEKIDDFLRIILTKDILSLDTETTDTDAMSAELVGISFSYNENSAFYVPVPKDREEAQKLVDKFKPVFENENSLKDIVENV